ncbi:MAG: transglycosylase SLT domain-containing protein [Candidatus Coatesbacteria bacterium]|nr:transglycosylase SLT domain-containing protein [Candidatus Coatesbacteria bacterium]
MQGITRPLALAAIAAAMLISPAAMLSTAHARGDLLRLTDALESLEIASRAEDLSDLFRQGRYEALIEALDDIARLFPEVGHSYHLDYLRAKALGKLGRNSEAALILREDAASAKGLLGNLALCDVVSLAVKAKEWGLAEDSVRSLARRYPLNERFKSSVSELAHALFDDGQFDAALVHFKRLGEIYQSGTDIEFQFMAASCLEKLGEMDEACEGYLDILMREERDDYSAQSLARILALNGHCDAEKRLGPPFHLAAGEVSLWDHKYADGIRHLKRISKGSDPQTRMRAEKAMALCFFRMKDYNAAAKRFEQIRREAKAEEDIDSINMYLGHCYSRLDRHAEAISRYRAVSREAADDQTRARAAFLLAREQESAGEPKTARAEFEALIKQYPDAVYAANARWRMVLAAFEEGNMDLGERELEEIIALGDRNPHYYDACYFMARVHELRGDFTKAAERYADNFAEFPNIYFGLISIDRLEQLQKENKIDPSALKGLVDETLFKAERLRARGEAGAYIAALRRAQALTGRESESWQKIAEMRDAFMRAYRKTSGLFALNGKPKWAFKAPSSADGLEDIASFFISLGMDDKGAQLLYSLSLGRPKDLDALYAAINIFERLDRRNETILLAERAFKSLNDLGLAVSDMPEWFVRALYPRGFSEHVEEYSKTNKVEPAIIYAIIREESRFQTESISAAAARGVMQLIVPTAKQVAESLGLGDMPIDELYEPKTNIALGVKYISQLLERFDGRLIFALASYNGGPSNVERWIRNCEDEVGDDEFINAITFSETRRYAQKVLASYRIYKWLYPEERAISMAQQGDHKSGASAG